MRILFHYTHKETLGHTTRSIALATALCRQKAQVLMLQGGIEQPYIRFPKDCKVLDIPHPFDDRRSFQSLSAPVAAEARAEFILKAAVDFSPDVFITEFFPFGRQAYMPELLPALRHLRKKNTRIIASIGYPLFAELERFEDKKFAALQQCLFDLFDQFLVHTPDGLEESYMQETIQSQSLARLYAGLMKNLRKRITYTGYVYPEKIITGGASLPAMKKDAATLIISRGGGAVYPKLITLAIEAQRQLEDITTIIACGPTSTSKEMSLFKSCLKPEDQGRVFLAEHLNDLDDYLRDCKVSVSLCGYNTSVQLMRHGIPSVIVPYRKNLNPTMTNDQIARARLLEQRFSSSILDYDTMTAAILVQAIKQQMSSPPPAAAPADWFNGADASARIITRPSGTAN